MKLILQTLLICIWAQSTCAFEYIGLSPLFTYGELYQFKYYTNLTPSLDNYTLDLDQKNNGLIINSQLQMGLALGIAGESFFTELASTPILDIGLSPVLKSRTNFISHVDNLLEAETKIHLIPTTAAALDNYKIQDSAQFELIGGVIFHLGAASGVLNAGVKVVTAGGWSCYVEKISENQIAVRLDKIKEIGTGLYANASIPYVEINRSNKIAHGMSFIIDYKSEIGMKAYTNFLRGQLDQIIPVENIITLTNSFKWNKKSKINIKGYGVPYIPFLNYKVTDDNSDLFEQVDDFIEPITNNHYSLSVKHRQVSVFNYKKVIDTAFLISTDKDETKMQLFFKYVSNFSRSNRLIEIRDTLKTITGLDQFLDFKIKDQEKLHFAQVQLAVNLGPVIVKNIKSKKFLVLLKNIKVKTQTEEKELNELLKIIKARNLSQIDMASFGQKLWNNSHFFQFAVNLVENCGGEISYEVSGKRISRLLKNLKFENQESCLLN